MGVGTPAIRDSAEASRRCVLVVDDDESTRLLMQGALTDFGHRVFEASNQTDALRVLLTEPDVEVMITDVLLRFDDGVQLSARALTLRPFLACVFATGDNSRAAELVASGAAVLRKPYSLVDLRLAVQDAVFGNPRPE